MPMKKKTGSMSWVELMDRVEDRPRKETAKPLADRVAEAEDLLADPGQWGAPVRVRMGRPRKGESREEVENMSFRAPRELKEAFTAAAEIQGIKPSEVLRMLAAAYVENINPKTRRKPGSTASKPARARQKTKRSPGRLTRA